MKLACEHPTLIFNPNLRWLVAVKCAKVTLGSKNIEYLGAHRWYNFPWYDFMCAKDEVSYKLENGDVDCLDRYFCVDDAGVSYPVFMLVPCGKCRLCRQKKVDDWCTRCLCESASSDFPPLFITLTYRPDARPDSGEGCKRDFQLFMKRLRIRVSRYLGVENHELRYFARSEKTPKNHYWHIHFLLWNMPFVACAPGDRNSFQTLVRFIQDAWSNGITKVERCRDLSGRYVMKYCLKDVDPEYWQLASRRNGIGYKYALSLLPTVLKNPDMTTFGVSDGKRVKVCAIPAYFKRIWFPTLSVLFPADVCKAAKDFVERATYLHYFMRTVYDHGSRCDDIVSMFSDVARKYRIMHLDFDDAEPDRRFQREVRDYRCCRDSVGKFIPYDFRKFGSVVVPEVTHDGLLTPVEHRGVLLSYGCSHDQVIVPGRVSKASLLTPAWFDFRYWLITSWTLLKRSYAILMKYEFDESEYLYRLSVTAQHQDYVRSMLEQLPEVDVDARLRQCEIDDAWVETNWMQSEIG